MRPTARLATPFLDVAHGLERCLRGVRGALLLAVGLVAGWWVYVPIHELLHAFACMLCGGEVTRLEIASEYGGRLLAQWFPFVVGESELAGRLSGFDTFGNDLIYLATDFGPFLLTLFPGVWALRVAAARRWALLFGMSLPFAVAPLMSLTGDAYEIGSILITQVPIFAGAESLELLRGDDLLERVALVREAGEPLAWLGLIVAALIGAAWAWLTCLAGGWIARMLGAGAVAFRHDG